jgi:hypothetical protein
MAVASGPRSTSLTFYDWQFDIHRWTWIDSKGIALELGGKFDGDSFVPDGLNPSVGDPATTVRMPNTDDGFKQVWSVSTDGGTTWVRTSDGKYTR